MWLVTFGKTMPGTKASGRPGGNPDFGKKYKIPRTNDEALDTLLAFKITRSLKEKLDAISDKNEFCRNTLINRLKEIDILPENSISVSLYQEDLEKLSSLAEDKDKDFVNQFVRDAVRKALIELDEE